MGLDSGLKHKIARQPDTTQRHRLCHRSGRIGDLPLFQLHLCQIAPATGKHRALQNCRLIGFERHASLTQRIGIAALPQ
ncbi:MAG: hypothetical protein ACJA2P_000745 [Rhodoferax sp.]